MRIHICGIYGSGKSTLASILSKEFGIKNYALDDIKYEVKFTKIRPVEERISELQRICNLKQWITEGTWSNFAEDAFKKADLIILVKTSKLLSAYRILRRHLLRDKHHNDTFVEALKLVKEIYKYYFTKQPVSLHMHLTLIGKYKKKLIIMRNKSDIPKIISYIRKDFY